MSQLFTRMRKVYSRGVSLLADKSKPYFIQNLIGALVISLFAVSVLFMLTAEWTQQPAFSDYEAYIQSMNVITFVLAVGALTAVQVLGMFLTSAERILPTALVVSVTVFCSLLQDGGHRNIWLSVGIGLVCYLACLWIFNRFESPFGKLKMGFGLVKILVAAMFVLFVGGLSFMSICRLRSFTYDTFDFGIFMQMFEYMKQTGLPITTVERNMELSHFAVHFSPFFYVLLPGYWLFSTPEYLCVMQVAFVGLGVFAVYGIAKHLEFSPKAVLLLCTLYLSYPSLSYGLFFDFHENKFLTFCILFTVYFLLKRKMIPFYAFALLTCSVKEDAALYLIAIALFMLLHEKMIKHGVITLALAGAFFVFALQMVQLCGALEGAEFGYRYENFSLDGEAGVGPLVKVTLFDLGYALTQMFSVEKVEYLLWMLLPVLFTPLMSKKISVLTLVAPMLLINLMSVWPYQYDIDYQYTFGVAGLVVAATVFALRSLSAKKRNILLLAAVMTCLAVTWPRVCARSESYIKGYLNKQEMFDQSIAFIDETLPKDSVIGVEGNVMPLMYDYPYLVLDPHNDQLAVKMEYYIGKIEDGDVAATVNREDNSLLGDLELYAENGYLAVYKNPDYPIFQETQAFIERVIPVEAAVGTRGGADMFMPGRYKNVSPNPHYDDLLMKSEYLVVRVGDYKEGEFTSRGFEFVGEEGYAAIFKNPDYDAFMTTVEFVEQTVETGKPLGFRGPVRKYFSSAYKVVHHDLPMEHLSTTVQYYIAKVGDVTDEELSALGFVKLAQNDTLVIYHNTVKVPLKDQPAEEEGSSPLLPLLLVAIMAVVIAGLAVLYRRKKAAQQALLKAQEETLAEETSAPTEAFEAGAVEESTEAFEETETFVQPEVPIALPKETKKSIRELMEELGVDVSGDDL